VFGLNGTMTTLLVGGLAVGGASIFAYSQGISSRDSALGHKFERRLAIEREVSIRREVNLWTQIGDERRARIELITSVQKIDEISAEARTRFVAALAKERTAAQAALTLAMTNIEELKHAVSESAENWKRGVVPDDITCGVFNGKGCDAPAYPAAGADPDDVLEVRDGGTASAPRPNP
jgi:hypothetical protein